MVTTTIKENDYLNDKEDNRYLYQIPPWLQKECGKPDGFHNQNEVTIKEKGNCKSVYTLKKRHQSTNTVEISNNNTSETVNNNNNCNDCNNMKGQLNNEINQINSLPKNIKVCEGKINIINKSAASTQLINKQNDAMSKNEKVTTSINNTKSLDPVHDEFNAYVDKISLVKQRQRELTILKERRNKLLHTALQEENIIKIKDDPEFQNFLRIRQESDLLTKAQRSDSKLPSLSDNNNKEPKKQNKHVRKFIVRKSIFIPKSSVVTNKSVHVDRKVMNAIDSSEVENVKEIENPAKITTKNVKKQQINKPVKHTTNKLIIEVTSKPVKLSSKELLYTGKNNPSTATNNSASKIFLKSRLGQDIDATLEKKKALKSTISSFALKQNVTLQKKPTSSYKSINTKEEKGINSSVKLERKSQSLITLGLANEKCKKSIIDNFKRESTKQQPTGETLLNELTNKSLTPLKFEKSGFDITNKAIINRFSPNSSNDNKSKLNVTNNNSTKQVLKIADNPAEDIKSRPEITTSNNKLLQYYRLHNIITKQEQKSFDIIKDNGRLDSRYPENKLSDNKLIVPDNRLPDENKKKQNLTNNKIQSESVEKIKNISNAYTPKPVSMPFPPSSQLNSFIFSSIPPFPPTAQQLKSLPSIAKSLSMPNQILSKKTSQKPERGNLKSLMIYPTKKDTTRRIEANNSKFLTNLSHKITSSCPMLQYQTSLCNSPSPILSCMNSKVNKSSESKVKFTLPKHRPSTIYLNRDHPKQRSNASRAVKDLIKSEVLSSSVYPIPSRLIIPSVNCKTVFDNSFAKQAKTSLSLSEPLKSDAYILPPTLHNNLMDNCTDPKANPPASAGVIDVFKDCSISDQQEKQPQNILPERIISAQIETPKENLKQILLDFPMTGTCQRELGESVTNVVSPEQMLNATTSIKSPSKTVQNAITEVKTQQSNQLQLTTKKDVLRISPDEPKSQGLTKECHKLIINSNSVNNKSIDSQIDLKNKRTDKGLVNSNQKSKGPITSDIKIINVQRRNVDNSVKKCNSSSKPSAFFKQYITDTAQLVMHKYRTFPARVKCCLKTVIRNYYMNEKIKLERERNELKLPLMSKIKSERCSSTLHTKLNVITQRSLKKERKVNFRADVLRKPIYRNNPFLTANKRCFHKKIKIRPLKRQKAIDLAIQTKLGTMKRTKKIALTKQNLSPPAPTMSYSEVLSIIFGEKKKPNTSKLEK